MRTPAEDSEKRDDQQGIRTHGPCARTGMGRQLIRQLVGFTSQTKISLQAFSYNAELRDSCGMNHSNVTIQSIAHMRLKTGANKS